MKSTVHIEAFTLPAYRAIRPALVAVITQAARSAGIPASEYSIVLMQTLKPNS